MDREQINSDPALLRRYLLGELDEPELERFEEDLFSREGLIDDLSVAEDDLIDAYVAGDLAGSQRARFESQFLTTPRRRERLEAARALRTSVIRSASSRLALVSATPARRPPLPNWMWISAAAAALVLIAGGTVFTVNGMLARQLSQMARMDKQVTRLQAELRDRTSADRNALLAELRQQTVGSRIEPAPPLEFVVPPADVRRDRNAAVPRLAIPSGSSSATLRLPITASNTAYSSYRVLIQTSEGAQIWAGDVARQRGPLIVKVPASVLKPGEYRVLVSGLAPSGEARELDEYYLFSVVAR